MIAQHVAQHRPTNRPPRNCEFVESHFISQHDFDRASHGVRRGFEGRFQIEASNGRHGARFSTLCTSDQLVIGPVNHGYHRIRILQKPCHQSNLSSARP